MAWFWGILAAVAAVDRIVKLWAVQTLTAIPGRVVWPGLLEWRYSENTGMALGLLSDNSWAGLILPVAAVAVWLAVCRKYTQTGYTRSATGLLLGGFLGNFADRLLLGYVVDMIYFPFLPWFICNVADIAICAGVAMLVISLLARPQDWRERHAKDDAERPA